MVAELNKSPLVVRRVRAYTPAAYLKIYARQADNIRSARFVPPRLGQRGWGKVIVEYITPVLTHGR